MCPGCLTSILPLARFASIRESSFLKSFPLIIARVLFPYMPVEVRWGNTTDVEKMLRTLVFVPMLFGVNVLPVFLH
ncbi:MAG: hypothetical protein NPIRA02_28460 [Nitrospirales bacterium]|nr:MAG: hypothetical protein NPIRA02_28460 [Nitrospirales bacterium]